MIFARPFMRKQFLSIRYFVVRGARRLVGELTVSTLATLIVTASLSNLFFASRPVPSAPLGHRNADAIIFSPQPIGPGNNGLEPVNLGTEAAVPGRDKIARDQNIPRKIPLPPIRTVDPAPLPPAPPVQLTGANIAAAAPVAEPSDKTSADAAVVQPEHFRPISLVFRPIHAIAGQLAGLIPKF
jgi:hypothetical protein